MELSNLNKYQTPISYYKELLKNKEIPKEVLKVEFGNQKTDDPVIDNKPKKDSKIKNKLKNWKTESTKEKEEEIELN